MIKQRSADFWFGLGFIGLAGFLFYETFGLSRSVVANSIESAFFPRVLIAGLVLIGALLALRTPPPRDADEDSKLNARPFILFVGLWVYLLAMPWLGYYVVTALLIAGTLFLFNERRPVIYLVSILGFLIVAYGLFDYSFGVLFPRSQLFPAWW
jgi:hypothetical protein